MVVSRQNLALENMSTRYLSKLIFQLIFSLHGYSLFSESIYSSWDQQIIPPELLKITLCYTTHVSGIILIT